MNALPEADFVAELRALEPRYWHDHPWHGRLHSGALEKEDLQLWAANRWYYQKSLPQKDAGILAQCPDAEVRRYWLDRVVYHDGRPGADGGAERWLRLAEAVGVPRDEVLDERHLLPGVRFAVDAYVNFARTKPWVEGIASGLTEMFAPGLMRRRVADMKIHYPWIEDTGFEYFTNRIEVTSGEGRSTLEIVVANCTTRAEQIAAVSALAFKCDVLQAILDALDYAALRRTS